MSTEGKSREELEREANQVRTRLLRTVEQLDQRRHQVLDVRSQLDRHAKQLAVAAGGALVASTAVAVALIGRGVRRARVAGDRRRRDRWRLVRHMWQHPERAMRGERRSFFGELGRSLLLSALSVALAIPVRRTVALLAERLAPSEVATPDVPAR